MSNHLEQLTKQGEQPDASAREGEVVFHDLSMTPADMAPTQYDARLPAVLKGTHSEAPRTALDDLSGSIEALAETEALSRVDALRERIEQSYFELGGVLSVIRRRGWFAEYGSFKDYVQHEFGKGYRSALQLVHIYERTVEIGLSYAAFKHVGWTVMRLLLPVLTRDNAAHWIALAEKKSRRELEELIDVETRLTKPNPNEKLRDERAKKLGFSPEQRRIVDRALDRAKNQSGREDELDRLAYICELYLERHSLVERLRDLPAPSRTKLIKSLLGQLDEQERQEVLSAFEEDGKKIDRR